MLPGTNRASDRFPRPSYYINAAKQTADWRESVGAILSVMRTDNIPIGIRTPGKSNIADALWFAVADQKYKV